MWYLVVEEVDSADAQDRADQAPGSSSVEPWDVVLLLGQEPIEPDSSADGIHSYALSDEVDPEQLRLAVGGTSVALPTETRDGLIRGTEAVRLYVDRRPFVGAHPLSEWPTASPFAPRVTVASIADIPTPTAAGGPADDALPLSGIALKQIANYLTPVNQLRADDDWSLGYLYELESNWEPLGWGLDEWIATIPMGPYEDSVLSETDITSNQSALTDSISGCSSPRVLFGGIRAGARTHDDTGR